MILAGAPLPGLAEQFGVSAAWARKISRARKRTGSMERQPYVPGPKVRVDREVVRGLLEKNADLYLHELQAELKTTAGIQVSVPHLWKIVGELGFKLKRSHSTRLNGTRK